MELLAVIEAEEQAEALIKEAQARREQAVRAALQQREEQLAAVKPLPVSEPKLKPLPTHVEELKARARRNKPKAVRMILEELHAA